MWWGGFRVVAFRAVVGFRVVAFRAVVGFRVVAGLAAEAVAVAAGFARSRRASAWSWPCDVGWSWRACGLRTRASISS